MKRIKLIALALAMLLVLPACNSVNVTEVARLGDAVVNKSEFMYYLQSGKSQAMTEAQEKGLLLEKDKDWETVMIDGVSAAQFAKDAATKSVRTMMVLEAKGKEAGFVMSETDVAEVASQKNQLIDQLGGRYAYEQTLSEMGIAATAIDTILERSVYANAYLTSISAEEGFMEPTEEEIKTRYQEKYAYIRHILISNLPEAEKAPVDAEPVAPPTENAPAAEGAENPAEPVDYDAEAKAKAEGILAELSAGADFIALMNEHSEDGRDENGKLSSDGYIMTDNGQMVAEFEDAAMNLEVGKYTTELVKTDFGYHILMRYELPVSGEMYDNALAEIKAALTSENLEKQIEAWAEELGLEMNAKFIDKQKVSAN